MEEKDHETGMLTRRKFLSSTLGAAALTAVGGTGAGGMALRDLACADETAVEEKVFNGSCRGNCFGGCPHLITVREDKVVKVDAAETPEPEYKRICQRGRSGMQTMYNDHRLMYPMRRVDGTARGDGQWERITWDEAIDEITSKWKKYQKENGPSSIAFHNGTGNSGLAFGTNTTFGYNIKLQNVMNATTLGHVYDAAYSNFTFRTGLMGATRPTNMLSARTIVLWGSNLSESGVQLWHFVMEAKQNGAKLIVVDPNYTTAAAKADVWIRPRPATDGLIGLALVNMLKERGDVDEDCVRNDSTLPGLLKMDGDKVVGQMLAGKIDEWGLDPQSEAAKEEVVMDTDGKLTRISQTSQAIYTGVTEAAGRSVKTQYDAIMERASKWTVGRCLEISGISKEDLECLYDALVHGKPTTMQVGLSIDHYTNGCASYEDLLLAMVLSGNTNKPGAGLDMYNMGGFSFQSNTDASMPTGPSESPSVLFQMLPEIMDEKRFGTTPLDIKSIFISYGNPLSNMPERKEIIKALDDVELVVVSDLTMNDTAQYADIVLPCAHYYEQNDVTASFNYMVSLQEQAVKPAGEAKTNYEIIQLLANGMGLGAYFDETEEDVMRTALDSDTFKSLGITYDRLVKEKVIAATDWNPPMYSTVDDRANFFFGDGGRWTTKLPMYGGFYDWGQGYDYQKDCLPGLWEPPHEAWPETVGGIKKNELADRFPLVFITYHHKMRCHTQFTYNPWLLEIYPEPTLMMNSADVSSRGLADGRLCRLYNDRGFSVFRVAVNDGIRPGIVVAQKGWQQDQHVAGHLCDPTSRYMNPLHQAAYYFDCLVEVEPYEEDE